LCDRPVKESQVRPNLKKNTRLEPKSQVGPDFDPKVTKKSHWGQSTSVGRASLSNPPVKKKKEAYQKNLNQKQTPMSVDVTVEHTKP
jgi:hypothetical protein